ncbi:hypothetical protein BV494_21630 (plasmid) [Rahnella sikkimica]|uniref:Uncharacterized protein n=1 Tax=Rahnella sikkimica TaxID=1805933 RepID=A0A2L1UXG9_9GAMM|nr:hypothetical protein BV494_21630 [Rahnella sikkimica]
MSISEFLRIIISTLVAGAGMLLGLISPIYSICCFFSSHKPYHILFGCAGILAFFIGYGLYKFALTYIYDERDYYR